MNSKKSFFLLDIDGTLLNSHYQSTEPRLTHLIQDLQDKGHVFALNSNRALEDLLSVAKLFGITGPLVGENGSFIYYLENDSTKLLINENEISRLIKIRADLKTRSLEFMQLNYPGDKTYWIDTDTVVQISKNDPNEYKDGSYIFLNNKYRKYTLSSHLRRIIHNSYEVCPDVLGKLVTYLQGQLSLDKIILTSSVTFNNLLMYPSSVSKRTGIENLISQYPEYELVVIGDEVDDFKMSDGLGTFYTVANADEKTKQHAKLISDYMSTKGVYDILAKITYMQYER